MQTQNNIFAALGLHTAKMLFIKYVTWRFVVALLHCAPYSGNNLCDVCLRHLPSFALFRSPVRFLWGSVTLYPLLFSFCLSALSHFHFCSSFSHLVDDSLVFESCVFCSMICSVVSLLLPGLSLFFLLLLLHPGSQPNLTYVSASDVLINNCTILTIMLNSSRPLLLPPVIHLNVPILRLSLDPTLCPPPHGRTSWDRSSVRWERSWAHLPVAWRNRSGEWRFHSVQFAELCDKNGRLSVFFKWK